MTPKNLLGKDYVYLVDASGMVHAGAVLARLVTQLQRFVRIHSVVLASTVLETVIPMTAMILLLVRVHSHHLEFRLAMFQPKYPCMVNLLPTFLISCNCAVIRVI